MPSAELAVNGSRHAGWDELEVRSSIEEVCQSFSFSFSERWLQDQKPVPISEGDECEVYCGPDDVANTKVLTGYVDEFRQQYDRQSHRMSVSGRSKAADLVDCSAIYKTGTLKNKRLEEVAAALCKPFGISVKKSPGSLDTGKVVQWFTINDGERVFDVLQRMAKRRGVLLSSGADGSLVLSRASTKPIGTAIVFGENVLGCEYSSNMRERFSEYTLKSQTNTSADWNGKSAAQAKAKVTDDQVPRHRPMVVHQYHSTSEDLKLLAKWERNTRAAAAERLTYTMYGWENSEGLWAPNQLVQVTDSRLRIDDLFLITAVTLKRSRGGGTTSVLELTHPEAYDVLQKAPKKRDRSGGGKPRLGL